MIGLDLLFLAAVVRLLLRTNEPRLCSIIYAFGVSVLTLLDLGIMHPTMVSIDGPETAFPWTAWFSQCVAQSIWGVAFLYVLAEQEPASKSWFAVVAIAILLRLLPGLLQT